MKNILLKNSTSFSFYIKIGLFAFIFLSFSYPNHLIEKTININEDESVGCIGDVIFAFPGQSSTDFMLYDMGADSWTNMANTPAVVNRGANLVFDGTYLYALRGDNKTDFWRYDIAYDSWTVLASSPIEVAAGGSMVSDGTYLYVLSGDNEVFFWRYDIAADSWASLAAAPNDVNGGGSLAFDGTDIYALRGSSSSDFWRYDISTDSWSSMASTPNNINNGGSLIFDGTYVYALRGMSSSTFYRYNIATDSWTSMASTPSNVNNGGALTFDGTDIYALRGDSKTDFWRYDIATDSWVSVAPILDNVNDGGSLVFFACGATGLNPEICNNSIDDDGDSLTDCNDPDCAFISAISNDTTICIGGAANLIASGGVSYSWSPATGLSATNISNPTATPTSTTTYTVVVTGTNGCTNTHDVTITIKPNAEAGSDVAICDGASINLDASGGVSYSWSPATGLSATNIPNPTATPTSTTTYTVSVTDSDGCVNTDDITVTLSNPVADASLYTILGTGNAVRLNANATGGIGNYTFYWQELGGNSPSYIITPWGTSTYTLEVTDSIGCTDTDDVTIDLGRPKCSCN